jgi:hypothetical protein
MAAETELLARPKDEKAKARKAYSPPKLIGMGSEVLIANAGCCSSYYCNNWTNKTGYAGL